MNVNLEAGVNSIQILTTDIEFVNTPTHRHDEHYQLIYAIKGSLHIVLQETNYFLPEGRIAIIPSHISHQLISKNVMNKIFLLYYPSKNNFRDIKLSNTNDFILENIRYISKQDRILKLENNSATFDYIISFLRLTTQRPSEPWFAKGLIAPKNERLQPILQYLQNNYAKDLKLNTVAVEFGFSERNLSRLFKKENISFNNYLNYQRIIRSIELFTDSKDNIEEISYAVGYNTPSNFSRTFRKVAGCSPTDFIKSSQTRAIHKKS